MINFIKGITIRKYWWLKVLWEAKTSFLQHSGWIASFEKKMAVDANNNPIPWISYALFKLLDDKDLSGISLFEYGIGSSSIYFSKKVKNLIGVEHNKSWFRKISDLGLKNSHFIMKELESRYVESIEDSNQVYDIVIVDGRKRSECLMFGSRFLSKQGIIILDDSHRKRYQKSIQFVESMGFKSLKLWGFGNGSLELKSSTIFYKNENCLDI